MNWIKVVKHQIEDVIVCGWQTARGSLDRATGGKTFYMVTDRACHNRLLLAQEATDDKSNKITTIPKLLELM